MIGLNPQQEEALQEMTRIAERHFDSMLLVVHAEDPDNSANENLKVVTLGGSVKPLGLVPIAQSFILGKLKCTDQPS